MKTRIISTILTTSMLVACLVGCQSSELRSYSDDAATNTDTTEETEQKDYTLCYETYKPDEVMMTVDGIDVTWDELFYWYMAEINNINMYTGGFEDFNNECPMAEGKTYSEFIQEDTLNTIKSYCALQSKAADMNITLSEDQKAALKTAWEENVTNYGGGDEEAFIESLKEVYLTKELYNHISEMGLLFDEVFKEKFGSNGEKLTEEQVIDKATDMGYMHAKHILIKTTDDSGTVLPDEQVSEKKQQAEDILNELKAIQDNEQLESRFDEIVKELGEDPGTDYYTDGYTFLPGIGAMAPEFEEATTALGDYELSDVTETSFGYHIILRLPLRPNSVVEYAGENNITNLSKTISTDIFSTMTEEWAEETNIKLSETYKNMDIAEVFSKATVK